MGESEEFTLLDLHKTGGNMVLAEMVLEFSPSDFFVRRPRSFSIIPPYSGSSLKLVSSEWNLVGFLGAGNFKLLLNIP